MKISCPQNVSAPGDTVEDGANFKVKLRDLSATKYFTNFAKMLSRHTENKTMI